MQVLLVEDDDALALLVEKKLTSLPHHTFEVVRLRTLAGALDFLQVARPDVVLLDLGLPDSRGLDTFRALEGLLDTAPVVIMSAIDERAVVTEALRAGASDFIVKGKIPALTLVEILQAAVQRHSREKAERQARDAAIREQIRKLEASPTDDPLAALETVRIVVKDLRRLVSEEKP